MTIKLAETKIAKQLSGHYALQADIRFAGYAFRLASEVEPISNKMSGENLSKSYLAAMKLADPALKAGGSVSFEDPSMSETQTIRCALFEAAIIAYGRCFNSGARTSINQKDLKKIAPSLIKIHDKIMLARNTHVAHTEMKQEKSIVGFQLVEDKNYGERPSTLFSIISARRKYPKNETLLELENHCIDLSELYITPIIRKKANALREQLLEMPKEQIDVMSDFIDTPPSFDDIFS